MTPPTPNARDTRTPHCVAAPTPASGALHHVAAPSPDPGTPRRVAALTRDSGTPRRVATPTRAPHAGAAQLTGITPPRTVTEPLAAPPRTAAEPRAAQPRTAALQSRTAAPQPPHRSRPAPQGAPTVSDHADRRDADSGGAPRTTAAPLTPSDTADAARLVAFGLQPKVQPARDQEYAELLRRYRDDPPFARLADAVATGLGLIVLEVSPRAGMAVTAAEDSLFAVRMGDYARRTAADSGDRFLHGLAHLAVAAMAFPRPEDLADDGYIGRVSVNGVDTFVRQACRRLEERAEETGENTDPASDAPGLEAAWRIWARRSATGATKDARRLAGSTTGIIGKAVAFLTDSGFLQRTGDDHGGTYRTTARYQLQVRDMAGGAAMAELLDLGIVPVTDGTPTLLPARDGDDLDLVPDAGLPFHATP